MLTPKQLEQCPDGMVELYAQLESDILADMARRIATYDYFIPSAQWQFEKQKELGNLSKDIIKTLSRATGKSEDELRRLMSQAGAEALAADDEIYRTAGKEPPPVNQSKALLAVLNAAYKKNDKLFKNLTKTTARTATGKFEAALDRAHLQIMSGAFDQNTAIRNAVKNLSKQGIGAVKYPSGHTDTIEAAVRRATVTGVNQTCIQLQLARAEEMGCDLVETSAHGGARPEHAVWQGRVFSLSGEHGKYPDFYKSTGYGTGAGLGGWNCRHSFSPFFEGISKPAYSKAELKDYEAKKYSYNGVKMTEYEVSQKQRYIERQKRRWKRENAAMAAAGLDTSESAAKIAKWSAIEKDFCRQTGLKRQAERSFIGTKTAGKGLNGAAKRGIIIKERNMANGLRKPAQHILTEDEIKSLELDITAIKADRKVFAINCGNRTGYIDRYDIITVKGDILPDKNSKHPRDLMSQRAVLAHEYYGHRANRGTKLANGSWNDEFRASYMAAKNSPGLTDEDRQYLVLDALERAKEAGVTINYNSLIRRILYGY